jgi:hypothetical protein
MKALVLMLAVLASPAHANGKWEAFAAGVIGAIIIANMVEGEKPEPPPPPMKKPPRTQYLESCVGYGFSLGYCTRMWDGKDATRESLDGVVITPVK